MTDTERERINAICKVAGVTEIDDLSDGFHTFRQLYYQRMILFATIVRQNKDKAWKSLRHEDGELCFGGGWFIVGIDTPEGSYTYHYEDNYYSLFDCEELERGKHWDGHTEKDVTRLLSLPKAQLSKEGTTSDLISRRAAIRWVKTECNPYGKPTLDFESGKKVIEYLEQMPTVQPEPQWIPVSERVPEEPYGCLVTVWDTNPVTMDEFENILPYFVGWDGEQWNDGDGEQCPFEVIAWMPLPEPYVERRTDG